MSEEHSTSVGNATPISPYLVVTRLPDGRYCVAFTAGGTSRKSYTTSAEQVVRQAQRAGGLPVRTDDSELQQRCKESALPLI